MDISKLTPAGQKNLNDISEGKSIYENLLIMTNNPMEHNEKFLMQLLEDNKNTVYGKKYGFGKIKSISDYQSKVPITEYDDYIEYIIPMSEDGVKNLITSYEVDHYSKSSGTLGNPKKIPLSVNAQKIMYEYTLLYTMAMISSEIGINWVDSRALNLVELSIETLKSGATYGALSAKFMLNFKEVLPLIYTSPFEAFFPEIDTNTRYLHSRFALMDKNINMGQAAFYNFFLEIIRYIESNWELLVRDIENGTIDESIKMSNEVRKKVLEKINPLPDRANEFREIFKDGFDKPIIPIIWPNMSFLVGIGTGGFSNYTKKIREIYGGNNFKFCLMGLSASEGNFSVPYELENPNSLLLPDSIFYEFRPVHDDNMDNILTLDQLKEGEDYELIITNLSGFYRYRMQDVIRVTGKYNNMPTIQFLYRLNQTVNLAGEKTTEMVLSNTLQRAEEKFNFDLVEFSIYPDSDASPPKYVFLIEALNIPENVKKEDIKNFIEEDLSKSNPSFGDKIKKRILGKIELDYLQEETHLLYRDLMIMKGISSAQLKPPRVIVNEVQRKFFFALTE
ncbi:hypothetical protein MBBAR_6c00210 [Methanobrevibacter arboriphilus JCM 13429 = DSM 1125]|uniref:GH3 auxin-responsive promoter n=1 Tax=Methanobrevibacter arboriphilus JCM 13429 = DSM 1125 TaxID=1300164 RepID=A0A1V6N2K6_METAZ|nr:GH3 auxin-responsive promoter family protein [Methanobrevibacter arboriphilus]OQD58911.1 hypothetical protein MBBAR_6c00210 [Methanobrevibacter arboriphilus JCM 13429 = DSM 1125]